MAYASPFTPGLGVAPTAPKGRQRELGVARTFAADVVDAQVETNGMLFVGTHGIGKSTLAAGIAEDLRSRGVRVAVVAARDAVSAPDSLRGSLEPAGMRGPAARFRDRVRPVWVSEGREWVPLAQ
jgi:hypothetical protein